MGSEPPLFLTELAQTTAQACNMPMGSIRLVGSDRAWVIARFGEQLDDTTSGESFCAAVLAADGPLVIEDMASDERFANDPMVRTTPFVRSAAGVAIPSEDTAAPMGTLCVFDTSPRSFEQTELLVRIAGLVRRGIGVRRALASRDQALAELGHVYTNLQAVLDGVGDLIQAVGPDGRFKYVNRAWRERMGYSEDVAAVHLSSVVHPDHHDGCARAFTRALQGRPGRVETVFVTREGESIEVEGSISAQTDSDGSVSTRGVFRDITARKRMERDREAALRMERDARQALQGQNLRLAEFDAIRSEFVSITSHELRTPLTSILGYCELLIDDDGLSTDHHDRIRVIQRNAERLLRLTRDLQIVAEGSAEIHLDRGPVALDRIANDAVSAAAPTSASRKVTVSTDLTSTTVIGDAARLGQIVDNVISNAVKFSPAGGTITVRVFPNASVGVIAVTDSGSGIDGIDQDHLFERFFRSEAARESGIPGTGLGLTVVKRLVDAHGGTIRVDSAAGTGTTFRIEIPRGPVPR